MGFDHEKMENIGFLWDFMGFDHEKMENIGFLWDFMGFDHEKMEKIEKMEIHRNTMGTSCGMQWNLHEFTLPGGAVTNRYMYGTSLDKLGYNP